MTTRDGDEIVIPGAYKAAIGTLLLAAASWAWSVNAQLAEISTHVAYLRDDVRELKADEHEQTEHSTAKPVTHDETCEKHRENRENGPENSLKTPKNMEKHREYGVWSPNDHPPGSGSS